MHLVGLVGLSWKCSRASALPAGGIAIGLNLVVCVLGGVESARCEAFCGSRREARDRSVVRNRGSRGVRLLELDRWHVAERLVQPAVVEPADVLHDGELELAAADPDAVGDQLGLEAVDEALGDRVVDRCRLRLTPTVSSCASSGSGAPPIRRSAPSAPRSVPPAR
jgi:hypothetical protein